jgi:hypothetical protein
VLALVCARVCTCALAWMRSLSPQVTYLRVNSLYAFVLGFLSTALVHRKFSPKDLGVPGWDACHAEESASRLLLKITQICLTLALVCCGVFCALRDLPWHELERKVLASMRRWMQPMLLGRRAALLLPCFDEPLKRRKVSPWNFHLRRYTRRGN